MGLKHYLFIKVHAGEVVLVCNEDLTCLGNMPHLQNKVVSCNDTRRQVELRGGGRRRMYLLVIVNFWCRQELHLLAFKEDHGGQKAVRG